MANYYALTDQGQTKSWGYYDIPINACRNIEFCLWGFDPIEFKGLPDLKYTGSNDFFKYKGLVPVFGKLENLRNFCKKHDFKLIKPRLLKPNPQSNPPISKSWRAISKRRMRFY